MRWVGMRCHTAAFKREGVRRAQERGNKRAVARELGIHPSLIRSWEQDLSEYGQDAYPGKVTLKTRN